MEIGAELSPSAKALEQINLLEASNWRVRLSAAKALAQMRNAQTVEPLLAALKDPQWPVRYQAANALGEIGDVRAVEPLGTAYKAWGWTRGYNAALALRQIGNPDRDAISYYKSGSLLPLRVLSSPILSSIQKLDSLQVLTGISIALTTGICGRFVEVRYGIQDVQKFCEDLCGQADTEESVKQGAEVVLAELRERADVQTLLRVGVLAPTQERQELLRGMSGESGPTPPDELLRLSGIAEEQTNREKPGILSRIFKRR